MKNVIVCGFGHVGRRVVEHLQRLERPVVVVTDHAIDPDIAAVIGDARDAEVLVRADLKEAAALIAIVDDDMTNIAIALEARRLVPTLPIVLRIFDQQLAAQIEKNMENVRALSTSLLAAPAFAEAAIGPGGGHGIKRRVSRIEMPRALKILATALPIIVALSVFIFSRALDLDLVTALYFVVTTITTIGYGDINLLHGSPALKFYGMFVMLSGAILMAILFGFVTDLLLKARIGRLIGKMPEENSVIVCGAGKIGLRVAEYFLSRRRPVTVIDANAERAVEGAAMMTGDARLRRTLEKARITSAGALLALTSDDAVNLGIALLAREMNPECRIVARIFDSDFATKLAAGFPIDAILSVSATAAPRFVEAAIALERSSTAVR